MKPKYWRRRRTVAPEDEHEVSVLLKPGDKRRRKTPLGGLAALLGHKATRRIHLPSDAAHAAVDLFAAVNGLVAVPDGRRRLTVRLRGTVQELSDALGVSLSEFEFHGKTHLAHDGDAHIPVPKVLQPFVHAVLPDRRPEVHPRIRGAVLAQSLPEWVKSESDVEGAILPKFTSEELRLLYGFPLGASGAGQSIGIIALGGGFYPEDMDEYFASLGRKTPKIVLVGDNYAADKDVTRDVMKWMNIRGAELASHPTEALASAILTVETSMDIQAAAAFAPEATIVVYTTPSTSLQDLLDVLNTIHDDEENSPSVVSCSFSLTEGSLPPYTELGIDYILQELAESGITVCVASGDFGAQGVSQFAEATEPQVMWPAASEWSLACGGTRILTALPKPRQVVFREVLGAPVGQMASGGGFSTKVDRPDWQTTAVDGWSVISSTTAPSGRGIPDVALNAHLESSFPIRVAGYDGTAGGTSAAAPVMGAWIACLNETLNTRLGHVTPLLYRPELAKTFEAVVRGDNDITSAVGGFHADAGWDPCTGLGAPSPRLLAALTKLHAQTDTSST